MSETSIVTWPQGEALARRAIERELASLHKASYAWALATCRYDRVEAQDVLQTAYVQVLDGRARFEGRSSLKTFLFAIIRRVAASRRRREWLRRALFETWVRPPEPTTLAADPQLGDRVRAAVSALAPRQREVIELVFFHDMTVEAAASVMGVSLGTARQHYDRGKRNLLAALATEEL